MENKNVQQGLVVRPKSKKELNSLMVYFDSSSKEDCLSEIFYVLSGILGNPADECVISIKDEKTRNGFFDYTCYLKNSGKKFDLSFSYMYGNNCVEISYGSNRETYIYNKYSKTRKLVLLSEMKINKENNNVYKREYSDYGAKFSLENGDYILSLDVSIHTKENREELIINKNEEELERYLLNLELPVNIFAVHINICKIMDLDLNELPNYNLRFVDKKKKGKHKEDIVSFSYGKNRLIKKDENNKTLIITEDGFRHIDRENNNEIMQDSEGIVMKSYYKSQQEMNSNDHFLYTNLNNSIKNLVEKLDNPATKSKQKNNQKIKKLIPNDKN